MTLTFIGLPEKKLINKSIFKQRATAKPKQPCSLQVSAARQTKLKHVHVYISQELS